MFLTTALAATSLLAAAPETLDISNPESIAAHMRESGYKAVIETDGEGDPVIVSGALGATFVVGFYGCTDNKDCADLQFHAGWSTKEKEKAKDVNAFNQEYRMIRAYIDHEDDPILEMDVMGVDGKVDTARFDRSLDAWTSLMGEFIRHFADRD